MSQPQYASVEELFATREKEILDTCVQCGECVSACPMFSVSSLKNLEPAEIAEKMFAVLEDGRASDEAFIKAFSCTLCGNCIDSCPQELNPMDLNQAVRHRLVEQGREIPEALMLLLPDNDPFLPGVLSGIQMKPSEARWLSESPLNPEKKEVVFYLGCSALASPDKNFALIDILERIGIDFATLIGGKLCCGVCDMYAGRLPEADSLAKNLIKNIKAFSPEKCVVVCPACYDMLKNVIPQYVDFDFEVQFFSTFLSDNLDRLNFTTPLNKKVTLHEPCPLARGFKDDMSLRKVIKALPGVELVEMKHNQEESLCCGSLAGFTYPEYAGKFAQSLMEEGKATKADLMINACIFCHVSLCALGNKYPFELSDLPTLVNLAQGGDKYEDKFRKYWGYKDLDKILVDAKECIEASNLNLDLLKQLLPVVFQLT